MGDEEPKDPFALARRHHISLNTPDDRKMEPRGYQYFARLPEWHPLEFAMLSVDRSPHDMPISDVVQHIESYDFAEELAFCLDVIQRQQTKMQLFPPRRPQEWLEWADEWEIDVPSALRQAVQERDARRLQRDASATAGVEPLSPPSLTWLDVEYDEELRPRPPEKPTEARPSAETRERDSLLKLVIGMAVKGYTYNPKSGRSNIPAEIASDLAELGLSLSDDTVRKYLREGAELLPPQDE